MRSPASTASTRFAWVMNVKGQSNSDYISIENSLMPEPFASNIMLLLLRDAVQAASSSVKCTTTHLLRRWLLWDTCTRRGHFSCKATTWRGTKNSWKNDFQFCIENARRNLNIFIFLGFWAKLHLYSTMIDCRIQSRSNSQVVYLTNHLV